MLPKILNYLLFAGVLAMTACGDTPEPEPNTVIYPEVFQKVLDAHGGKATWDLMHTFVFTRGEGTTAERHLIDLDTRKVRVVVEDHYQLGFDGKQVWVTPNRDSFPGKSPRFFHNLHFYFAAIPFVFTDPGVQLTDRGLVEVDSQSYHLINVAFNAGIGDAPEDQYNMYIDPETYRVDFITYSVTYFDTPGATSYNALQFDWVEVNGLLVPKQYVGFKWKNNSFGEKRYASVFSGMHYQKTKQPADFFSIPAGAFTE